MKGFLRSAFFVLLVIILSFWAVKPLFYRGFFPMHDDTQPSRVYEMARALSYGQFPVRWVGELGYGYGYPLFNFYAPLPYYLGGSLVILGLDALVATKIMFTLGILFAGVTMFFFLRSFAADFASLAGSILYVYAPYHAVDIYVRGAVGELYAVAFLPLVLWGVYKIVAFDSHTKTHTKKKGILVGSVGFAAVLLSHNIIGMIAGYFFILGLAVYLLVTVFRRQKLTKFYLLLLIFMLGLGISSFFIFPAILEKNFTRVDELTTLGSNFKDHFVFLDQLWSSPWGFGGSAPGRADGMSFMIGKIHLLLGLLSIPVVFILYQRKKIDRFQFSIFNFSRLSGIPSAAGQFSIFVISVFLMLEQSKFIWDLMPGFPFIQYPWRFLVFAVFAISALATLMFTPMRKNVGAVFSIAIVIFTIWFNSRYFVPKEYLMAKPEDYTSPVNLRFKISKISDEYLPHDFIVPKTVQDVSWQGLTDDSNLKINDFADTPAGKIYNVNVSIPYTVQTNIAYFPGWQAKIDGKTAEVNAENGRVALFLPQGQHRVEFVLRDTPIRFLANAISIFSLFLVVYIIVFISII